MFIRNICKGVFENVVLLFGFFFDLGIFLEFDLYNGIGFLLFVRKRVL